MTTGDSIRFLLGQEPRELKDISPTLTVLEYLRKVERMVGTKEGCAEGDCGACTVVLAENESEKISYKAVNSCIMFVPFLHGKQLITVEHLKDSTGNLHPAQQALVDEHGSQCGFCTPGFVMSMFAFYHNRSSGSRKSIDDALAGNLCRCTGYAPIVRATRKMLSSIIRDEFDKAESKTIQKLSELDASAPVELTTNGQAYFAPNTVAGLAQVLNLHPKSRIVAGATDVGIWVTKQGRHLQTVVYTGGIEVMKEINVAESHIQIGAAATVSDAMKVLSEYYPALEELFRRYGSLQIRNLATIGGNVANGSPIGDSLPALIALDAKLIITGSNGSRTVPAEDFFIDYGKQDLQPGEFLERVDVPLPAENQKFMIYKLSKRFHQDISAVCGAFSITKESNSNYRIRVCYGGMAATPLRARNCENALMSNGLASDDSVHKAKQALNLDFSPITDFRGSSDYRSLVAGNLIQRFVNEWTSEQATSVWAERHG